MCGMCERPDPASSALVTLAVWVAAFGLSVFVMLVLMAWAIRAVV